MKCEWKDEFKLICTMSTCTRTYSIAVALKRLFRQNYVLSNGMDVGRTTLFFHSLMVNNMFGISTINISSLLTTKSLIENEHIDRWDVRLSLMSLNKEQKPNGIKFLQFEDLKILNFQRDFQWIWSHLKQNRRGIKIWILLKDFNHNLIFLFNFFNFNHFCWRKAINTFTKQIYKFYSN